MEYPCSPPNTRQRVTRVDHDQAPQEIRCDAVDNCLAVASISLPGCDGPSDARSTCAIEVKRSHGKCLKRGSTPEVWIAASRLQKSEEMHSIGSVFEGGANVNHFRSSRIPLGTVASARIENIRRELILQSCDLWSRQCKNGFTFSFRYERERWWLGKQRNFRSACRVH